MNAWPAVLLAVALMPMAGLLWPGRWWAARWLAARWLAARRWPARPGARPGNRLRHLAAGALWRFGLPVPILLALAGRLRAVVALPPEFAALSDRLDLGRGDPRLVGAMVAGGLLGMAAAALVTAWRAWRGRRARYWFGDFAALEAASSGERGWAVALSLVAGVTEEGYFRLLLPLLAAMALPGWGAAAGFAGSTLLFAAAHRYQGWRGMATTGVVGVGMAGLYLGSGSLWLAIAYHALVDVGSLVLRPWLRQAIERRRRSARDVAARRG